jgi:hypothetical protein
MHEVSCRLSFPLSAATQAIYCQCSCYNHSAQVTSNYLLVYLPAITIISTILAEGQYLSLTSSYGPAHGVLKLRHFCVAPCFHFFHTKAG